MSRQTRYTTRSLKLLLTGQNNWDTNLKLYKEFSFMATYQLSTSFILHFVFHVQRISMQVLAQYWKNLEAVTQEWIRDKESLLSVLKFDIINLQNTCTSLLSSSKIHQFVLWAILLPFLHKKVSRNWYETGKNQLQLYDIYIMGRASFKNLDYILQTNMSDAT
jgi:hypothetical protein